MSLHRVVSIENWERADGARGASPSRPRKMSFNPIGDWPVLDQPTKPVSVGRQLKTLESSSVAKRIAQIVIACIYCLLAAGVVFGFAALKPVLIAEGVYGQYCTDEDPGDDENTCYEQEVRLNLLFTIAAVATNVSALPVGTILDRYGPKVSSVIGSLLLAAGSAFLIAAPHSPFDCYIPGYLFLALGGPFIFISAFQLSNAFPRNSGLVLALLTGSFDTSSAMLLIYRLMYQSTNQRFKPSDFFTVYLIVPVFILVVQFLIMPSESYKTVGEMISEAETPEVDPVRVNEMNRAQQASIEERLQQRHNEMLTEIEPLLGRTVSKQEEEESRKQNRSGVWGVLHGKSALQQIRTPWFILIAMFVVVQMTRINYFVATIRSQYTEIFHDRDLAIKVNNFFDIALPVGGVISIPFIGLLLDNLSTVVTLSVLTVIATLIGILGILPYPPAAYANIILFVLYRPLYYTAVSDYAAKVFGFHTFGKVYGLIICAAGLFNFSQSALDALTHALNNNPVPANILLMALITVIGTTLVIYVYAKSRTLERDALEEEAEASEQREQLLPAATDRPGSDRPAGYDAN